MVIEKIRKQIEANSNKEKNNLQIMELFFYTVISIIFTILFGILVKDVNISIEYFGLLLFQNITAAFIFEFGRKYILKRIKDVRYKKQIKWLNITKKEFLIIILLAIITNLFETRSLSLLAIIPHIIYGLIAIKSNNCIEATVVHFLNRGLWIIL